MKRREWLKSAQTLGALAGGIAIAELFSPTSARAQGQLKGSVKKDNPDSPKAKGKTKKLSKINASSPVFVELLESLEECKDACGRCYAFCLKTVSPSDTSLLGCLKALSELIPVCEATLQIARLESAQTLDLARACGRLCGRCAEECKKHRENHTVCADCLESCIRTQKACKALEA